MPFSYFELQYYLDTVSEWTTTEAVGATLNESLKNKCIADMKQYVYGTRAPKVFIFGAPALVCTRDLASERAALRATSNVNQSKQMH